MWEIETTDPYERRLKRYLKKLPRETVAVLDNLDTYVAALKAGSKPAQIQYGFLHREPGGVVAIDQKRGGTGLKETRLYAYAWIDEEVVFLITLGDKKTQSDDIQECVNFVKRLGAQNG